jgi:transglutaminase-like putative cysteine protease
MRDATVERLAKIIADSGPGDSSQNNKKQLLPRRPTLRLHLGLAEGWFSLFLVATVVYSTIWCVQAVGWVVHLDVLSLTTLLGLVGGVVASKQHHLPRLAVHVIAVVFGLLLAYWQTAGAFYAGNVAAFTNGIHRWIQVALVGGTSNDDSIFLFFILALGFLLAYASAWLVYRTRRPWLMIVANAVVLLINLSNVSDGYIVFLIIFLIAALLLLLRFNLYESAQGWRRLGLRCADDLGWDFMQAGALISIGILILSWLLPWGYTNGTAAQIWTLNANPIVDITNLWNRLVSVNGGSNPSNHGNFTDTLVLGGNPNLNNAVVFNVSSTDGSQYLASISYSTYTGTRWINGTTASSTLKANEPYYNAATDVHPISQTVTVVNPPGEQDPYIFGATQISTVDQNTEVLTSAADGSVVSFLRSNGRLAGGDRYTVTSYISSADVQTLQSVPLPKDAPVVPPNFDGQVGPNVYDPQVLQTYLQLPSNLNPRILALAKQITSGAPTMYDKAVALETYFHNNFKYNANVGVPQGEEPVSWFLFNSGNQGFCNYFATAMTVMARELGIPARVVSGYTNGTYDAKHNVWVVKGTDAHSWAQIYFAGYGWVNFEPSVGYSTFARPLPGQFGSTGSTTNPGTSSTTTTRNKTGLLNPPDPAGTGSVNPALSAAEQQAQFREQVSLTLGSIVLLILLGLAFFSIWWRRLFRGYGISAQIFGRLCILANWAGISLQPSQTPYEYIHKLAEVKPDEAATLERLGDIYVRDRWADPASTEHPARTGENGELPGLWKGLQPRLFVYVLRHPYFLRKVPQTITSFLHNRRSSRHTQGTLEEEL